MTMNFNFIQLAAIIGLTLLPMSAASAHDAASGPNGGTMVQLDDKHLELTTTNEALVVYVTDTKHDPIATVGATGRAIVQADGKTTTVALAPTAPNILTGKPEAPLAKGTRIVVTAIMPSGANMQARFVIP